MRQGKDRRGNADTVIRYDRDGQHRQPGHGHHDNLGISAALVAGSALLEAVVRVGGAVAVRFLERHRRPGLFDARLRDGKSLGEQQRSDKQSGGTDQRFAGQGHVDMYVKYRQDGFYSDRSAWSMT